MPDFAVVTMAIFPFDPQMDTPLGHRNLIAIYVLVWVAQLAYASYAFRKYRSSAKRSVLEREE